MSDWFSCTNCHISFDQNSHIPKLLQCGHNFCLKCLFDISKHEKPLCPSDQSSIFSVHQAPECFPTNSIILLLLEEQSKDTLEWCQTHSKAQDLVCLTDRCRICQTCKDIQHQRHKTMLLKDVKERADQKKIFLKDYIEKLCNAQDSFHNDIAEKKNSLETYIRNGFNKLKTKLDEKEKNIIIELHCFLTRKEKQQMDKIRCLTEKFQRKIYDLNNPLLSERYFKTLEWPISCLEDSTLTLTGGVESKLANDFQEADILIQENLQFRAFSS